MVRLGLTINVYRGDLQAGPLRCGGETPELVGISDAMPEELLLVLKQQYNFARKFLPVAEGISIRIVEGIEK